MRIHLNYLTTFILLRVEGIIVRFPLLVLECYGCESVYTPAPKKFSSQLEVLIGCKSRTYVTKTNFISDRIFCIFSAFQVISDLLFSIYWLKPEFRTKRIRDVRIVRTTNVILRKIISTRNNIRVRKQDISNNFVHPRIFFSRTASVSLFR